MYDIVYLLGRGFRRSRAALAAVVIFLLSLATASASAAAPAAPAPADDWTQHTAFGLDLGLGSIISRYSPTSIDGGGVFYISLHGSYDVTDDLALQLSLKEWLLPDANSATMPSLGARYEPYRNEFGRGFVDASLGIAFTGDATSLGFDVGTGFELELPVVPGLSLGPAFRYSEVIDPAPRNGSDGRAWQLGVSATFHIGRAEAAAKAERALHPNVPVRPWVFKVPDSDHDGITDDADECPDVPAGRHPDPYRRGCPENDEDRDGFSDSDDDCPLTPAGDHPDPKRRGCPIIDTDNDGIPDADDQCPNKAGPPSPNPGMNGCPDPQKAPHPAKKAIPEPELPAPSTPSKRALNHRGQP